MDIISETNVKNILRTLSGWFLSKHPVNNVISLNPEIKVSIQLYTGVKFTVHIIMTP